jgi:mono/diheme cytochrome c family protein
MNAKLTQQSIRCLRLVIGLSALFSTACSDEADPIAVVDDEALVARGQYLVDVVAICADCHTPRGEDGAPIAELYMSGAECFVELENESCLNTRNLTNHETGLANRSDAEIKRMFGDGIRPTATGDVALFPVMPYYVFHNMTDADKDAIVAYLRTIPGVEHDVPRSGPEFERDEPASFLNEGDIPLPREDYDEPEAALRGRYLATEAGVCIECHTARIDGDPGALDLDAVFGGGEEFGLTPELTAISKNLTSDAETGLGEWSIDEILTVLKDGVDRDGDGICPPMPVGPMGNFVNLDPDDALDIAHYIKSLPPVVNEIDDMCTWPPM